MVVPGCGQQGCESWLMVDRHMVTLLYAIGSLVEVAHPVIEVERSAMDPLLTGRAQIGARAMHSYAVIKEYARDHLLIRCSKFAFKNK